MPGVVHATGRVGADRRDPAVRRGLRRTLLHPLVVVAAPSVRCQPVGIPLTVSTATTAPSLVLINARKRSLSFRWHSHYCESTRTCLNHSWQVLHLRLPLSRVRDPDHHVRRDHDRHVLLPALLGGLPLVVARVPDLGLVCAVPLPLLGLLLRHAPRANTRHIGFPLLRVRRADQKIRDSAAAAYSGRGHGRLFSRKAYSRTHNRTKPSAS